MKIYTTYYSENTLHELANEIQDETIENYTSTLVENAKNSGLKVENLNGSFELTGTKSEFEKFIVVFHESTSFEELLECEVIEELCK